jgi:hypothetical protein
MEKELTKVFQTATYKILPKIKNSDNVKILRQIFLLTRYVGADKNISVIKKNNAIINLCKFHSLSKPQMLFIKFLTRITFSASLTVQYTFTNLG